jgi:hypothetical protein
MSYRIFVEIDYQLDALKKSIDEAKGIKVSELCIHQLISEDPNLNHGIYVFKNQSDETYVGRCTSRSYVERIAAHFDNRDNAWMNTILKKVSKSKNITIQESYSYFLNSFELVLIPFNTNLIEKTRINALEKELINCIGTLNKKNKL